jgi:pyruvate kinase
MDRINKNIFYQDSKTGNLMAKVKDKSIPINTDTYVKVTIESRTFNDMDTIIMAMGFLENIASDEEKKQYFDNEYQNQDNIKYDNYLNLENVLPPIGEITEENIEDLTTETTETSEDEMDDENE